MWDVFWIFVVVFAVFGMLSALYCLWGWLFRPGEQLLLFAHPSDPEGLMAALERVRWMQSLGVDARLYILEDSLDRETRKAAELLAGKDGALTLCKTEDLYAYVPRADGRQDPFGGLQ